MQRAFLDGRSKADIAHKRLKDLIINGTLSAGEPLNVQHLSDRLQIGLTPIREALLRLQTEKFVAWSKKRGGLQVRLIGLKEAADLYDFALLILRHAALDAPGGDWVPAIIPATADSAGPDRWSALVVARHIEQVFARLALASANHEMVLHIQGFNERTRLMRLIEIENGRPHEALAEIAQLEEALRHGRSTIALAWLDGYFHRRRDSIPALVKEAIARNHILLHATA